MWNDPLHDPRVQIADQERRRREEKGIYQGIPFFTWTLCTIILLIVAFVIVLYLFHFF